MIAFVPEKGDREGWKVDRRTGDTEIAGHGFRQPLAAGQNDIAFRDDLLCRKKMRDGYGDAALAGTFRQRRIHDAAGPSGRGNQNMRIGYELIERQLTAGQRMAVAHETDETFVHETL